MGKGRVGALWRTLACPDVRTLCEEIALVAWAEGAEALGDWVEPRGGGMRLQHPRSSSVWRPQQFPRFLDKARKAWEAETDSLIAAASPMSSRFFAGGCLVEARYGSPEWSATAGMLLAVESFSDVWPELVKLAAPVEAVGELVEEHRRRAEAEARARGRPPDRSGGA